MCLGILASLLLAEGVLRFLPTPDVRRTGDGAEPRGELWVDPDWRLPPPRAFRLDPVLHFDHERWFEAPVRIAEHRGGQFRFRTNGYGLRRDDEIDVAKPAGTYCVLVLGDSQTDGLVDNDETDPARLEASLGDRGPPIEVLNAGVTGYAPQQEYLWYRTKMARLLDLTEDELAYDEEVRARLLALAAAANMPAIDPLDDLRSEAGAARLYYRRDWHLNPAGNAALARILERHLTERSLVPR